MTVPVAVGEAGVLGLDHQHAPTARPPGRASGRCRSAPGAPVRSSRRAFERPDPPLVAGPAGLDPLADPDLLLGQPLVEEGVLALLGRQRGLLALEEGRVVARPVEEPAAVDLDDPGGQPAEERPVVGDEDQRPAEPEQVVFEPADRLDVQVVRRLVEQQDVGLADQRPGEQDPALHARGERLERGVGVELHPREDPVDRVAGRVAAVALVEPGGDLVEDRAAPPLGDLLDQPGDPDPLRADHLALVGREVAVEELQERRLPRPVPADQPDPLAALDLPVDLVEQRGPAERHAHAPHADQRHGPIAPRPDGPSTRRPDLRDARPRSGTSLTFPAPGRQSRGWHRRCWPDRLPLRRGEGRPMSRLTEFYRGQPPDNRGRTLADLWAFSDDRMEAVHDFIQWMFPLREPSQFNPEAPLLTDADVAEFRADPAMPRALRRSFERFLAFLGLALSRGARSSRGPTSPARPTSGGSRTTTGCGSPGSWPAPGCSAWRPRAGRSSTSSKAQREPIPAIDPDTFGYWERAAGGRTGSG